MARGELIQDRLTHSVIGAFYEVHNTLGFGFLEPIYTGALALELQGKGHVVDLEVSVRVSYKGTHIGWQRLDMLVDGVLAVEVKSTAELHPSARRQLLNYLCGTRLEVGLLLHFGPSARFYRVVRSRAKSEPNG